MNDNYKKKKNNSIQFKNNTYNININFYIFCSKYSYFYYYKIIYNNIHFNCSIRYNVLYNKNRI